MFKIVRLKFQNLQLSFQNFTTPIAKVTTQIAKFTTECSKFCLGGCGTPPHPPVQPPLNVSKVQFVTCLKELSPCEAEKDYFQQLDISRSHFHEFGLEEASEHELKTRREIISKKMLKRCFCDNIVLSKYKYYNIFIIFFAILFSKIYALAYAKNFSTGSYCIGKGNF